MVTARDVMAGIQAAIASKFPAYSIYLQVCPKNITRPSFMIQYIKTNQRDVCRYTVEKTVDYKVTGFPAVNEFYCSDPNELSTLQEDTMQLFSNGFVSIGDRAIKVKSSTGGMDPDRVYLDLQFEYFDDRTDAEDSKPFITSVTTNIQEG